MGLLKKLFGQGGPTPGMPALEALACARAALESAGRFGRGDAHLCCLYTSGEDANLPLEKAGRPRAWHVDFHVPREDKVCLVRVRDGKARPAERALGAKPVEYVYAAYGPAASPFACPPPAHATEPLVDSTAVAEAALDTAHAALRGTLEDPRQWDDYYLFCIAYPAGVLRLLHAGSRTPYVTARPCAAACYGVIVAHVDVDAMDSALVHVDAVTGAAAACDVFRFRALESPGYSRDW